MSRVYLKIKVMSLAAEARIIRREEKKWPGQGEKTGAIRHGLHHHRVWDVRQEARAALVAYGFVRGRTYAAVEGGAKEPPSWGRVLTLVNRYGDNPKVTREELEAWSKVAEAVPA